MKGRITQLDGVIREKEKGAVSKWLKQVMRGSAFFWLFTETWGIGEKRVEKRVQMTSN